MRRFFEPTRQKIEISLDIGSGYVPMFVQDGLSLKADDVTAFYA